MQAMILAAGRGERMRPLSDTTPKPLLCVGGKPLIVWQIERLVAAGFTDLVINVAHLGAQIQRVCGDGSAFGATIRYSVEAEPLEVAGGIATALPLLAANRIADTAAGVTLVTSGDIHTGYDFARLGPRLEAMNSSGTSPHAHMVMVANPPYHPHGDFGIAGQRLTLGDGARDARFTFGNIALYRNALFQDVPRGTKLKIVPLYRDWIARDWVSAEIYDGLWANVGTPHDLEQLDAELLGNSTKIPGAEAAEGNKP
jgi:N-acetyl-alpha-D-muramate 1-phosphate uridylyltransferase